MVSGWIDARSAGVAALVDREVLRFEPMHVAIELRGTHTYGMTLCDARHLREADLTPRRGHPGSRPSWRSTERGGGGCGERRPLLGDVSRRARDLSVAAIGYWLLAIGSYPLILAYSVGGAMGTIASGRCGSGRTA